jgi:hypothetical protein
METRTLGKTGLKVSRLGAGLAEIGSRDARDKTEQAGSVLNEALDAGINFLDTAACYGVSETLIGNTVSKRRDEFILATKCGHVTDDYEGEPWTAKTITDSIDRSLKRMKTDYIDLIQLHTCDIAVLEKGEAVRALQNARQAGKARYIGYSGDNGAAEWAVQSGLFDTLQTSFNLVDQYPRHSILEAVREKEMGLIVKRPIANAVWGAKESPNDYAEEYFRRYGVLSQAGPIPEAPADRILLSLGFTLAHEEVDVAIIGTKNPEHMKSNIKLLDRLPISAEAVSALHERYDKYGSAWEQKS